MALLRWLPHDAAVWTDEPPSWTVDHELLATQVELTHALARISMQAAGAKRGRLPKPLHIPRPTERTARGRGFDHEAFTKALASMTPKSG